MLRSRPDCEQQQPGTSKLLERASKERVGSEARAKAAEDIVQKASAESETREKRIRNEEMRRLKEKGPS